jgi:hypothetical protein
MPKCRGAGKVMVEKRHIVYCGARSAAGYGERRSHLKQHNRLRHNVLPIAAVMAQSPGGPGSNPATAFFARLDSCERPNYDVRVLRAKQPRETRMNAQPSPDQLDRAT